MSKTGYIYIIKCSLNLKCYIGQTIRDIPTRWKDHKSCVSRYEKWKNGCYDKKPLFCLKLVSAMHKYGIDKFMIEQLDEVELEYLDDTEMFYIKLFGAVENGYNIRYGAATSEYSDEHRQAISLKARRYNDILDGLPMHCIYKKKNENDYGYAIFKHSKCFYKSFMIKTYKTMEKARAAMLLYYDQLEKGLVNKEKHVKPHSELPKGLRFVEKRYTVNKIINGVQYYKSFNQGTNEENLRDALEYLNSITIPIPLPIQN